MKKIKICIAIVIILSLYTTLIWSMSTRSPPIDFPKSVIFKETEDTVIVLIKTDEDPKNYVRTQIVFIDEVKAVPTSTS